MALHTIILAGQKDSSYFAYVIEIDNIFQKKLKFVFWLFYFVNSTINYSKPIRKMRKLTYVKWLCFGASLVSFDCHVPFALDWKFLKAVLCPVLSW